MAKYGADVSQLRALSKEFLQTSQSLESCIRGTTSKLREANWRGPLADSFRDQWSSLQATATSAAQLLREAGATLNDQANEQAQISDGIGSANSFGPGLEHLHGMPGLAAFPEAMGRNGGDLIDKLYERVRPKTPEDEQNVNRPYVMSAGDVAEDVSKTAQRRLQTMAEGTALFAEIAKAAALDKGPSSSSILDSVETVLTEGVGGRLGKVLGFALKDTIAEPLVEGILKGTALGAATNIAFGGAEVMDSLAAQEFEKNQIRSAAAAGELAAGQLKTIHALQRSLEENEVHFKNLMESSIETGNSDVTGTAELERNRLVDLRLQLENEVPTVGRVVGEMTAETLIRDWEKAGSSEKLRTSSFTVDVDKAGQVLGLQINHPIGNEVAMKMTDREEHEEFVRALVTSNFNGIVRVIDPESSHPDMPVSVTKVEGAVGFDAPQEFDNSLAKQFEKQLHSGQVRVAPDFKISGRARIQ